MVKNFGLLEGHMKDLNLECFDEGWRKARKFTER